MDPSAPITKKDGQYEAFAQHLAVNNNATAAYLHAVGKKGNQTHTNGSKWSRKGIIKARVEWIRAAAARELAAKNAVAILPTVLSVVEKREYLARALRVPLGDIDERDPLCVEATYNAMGGIRGRLRRGKAESGNEEAEIEMTCVKIKKACPLRAIEQDNDLAGEGAAAAGAQAAATRLSLDEMLALPAVAAELRKRGWVKIDNAKK